MRRPWQHIKHIKGVAGTFNYLICSQAHISTSSKFLWYQVTENSLIQGHHQVRCGLTWSWKHSWLPKCHVLKILDDWQSTPLPPPPPQKLICQWVNCLVNCVAKTITWPTHFSKFQISSSLSLQSERLRVVNLLNSSFSASMSITPCTTWVSSLDVVALRLILTILAGHSWLRNPDTPLPPRAL